MKKLFKLILSAAVLFVFAVQPGMAQNVYKFKISVDTVMNHPRNQAPLLFMDGIKKRSGDRLMPDLFHSGQLYKGRAVPKALRLGPCLWENEYKIIEGCLPMQISWKCSLLKAEK